MLCWMGSTVSYDTGTGWLMGRKSFAWECGVGIVSETIRWRDEGGCQDQPLTSFNIHLFSTLKSFQVFYEVCWCLFLILFKIKVYFLEIFRISLQYVFILDPKVNWNTSFIHLTLWWSFSLRLTLQNDPSTDVAQSRCVTQSLMDYGVILNCYLISGSPRVASGNNPCWVLLLVIPPCPSASPAPDPWHSGGLGHPLGPPEHH